MAAFIVFFLLECVYSFFSGMLFVILVRCFGPFLDHCLTQC